MAPTLPSSWLLFLLLLGVGATAAARGSKKLTPPVSTAYEWPERFHAVVVSINLTNHKRGGGRLQLIELYYDWPHGRDLNIVRDQLSGDPPLYSVEWANGTSYLFDTAASSCRTFQFPVGILPPDWIATADYLGRDTVDGFECHVWRNFLFSRYYADVATGRPVRWIFNGNTRHVLVFEAGVVLLRFLNAAAALLLLRFLNAAAAIDMIHPSMRARRGRQAYFHRCAQVSEYSYVVT